MNMKSQKIFIFLFIVLPNLFCLAGPINPPQPTPPPPPPVPINDIFIWMIFSIAIGYFFTINKGNRGKAL